MQCADENVRVSDDRFTNGARLLHGRSTSASASASVILPRRIALAGDAVEPATSEVPLDRLGRELLDGRALGGGSLLDAVVDGIRYGDAFGGHDELLQVYAGSPAASSTPSTNTSGLGTQSREQSV